MSIKATKWAWEQALDPTCLLVLLALSDIHNGKSNLCCPSISTITKKAKFSRMTVCRSLNKLEKLGLITLIKKDNSPNKYTLNIGLPSNTVIPAEATASNPELPLGSNTVIPPNDPPSNTVIQGSNSVLQGSNTVSPTSLYITGINQKQPEKKRGSKNSPRKKNNGAKKKPSTAETWKAYSAEYFNRYGTEPVRNAKVNGQLAQFVSRVPLEEAPLIAAFYIYHENYFYVQKGHSVGLLLADAEKLRTEWATNTRITSGTAKQRDRTQTNANAFASLLAEAEERERKDESK